MTGFIVEVTHAIHVRIDEEKFTPLMDEFNRTISNFGTGEDAIKRHARHIARLAAEGFDFDPGDFVEGYGIVKDAGIWVAVENSISCNVIGA